MTNEPQTPSPVDSAAQALTEALHSSFAIVKVVMAILFVVFVFSGLFKVEPQEKAIKLRFGKPVGTGDQVLIGSGTHWAWWLRREDTLIRCNAWARRTRCTARPATVRAMMNARDSRSDRCIACTMTAGRGSSEALT